VPKDATALVDAVGSAAAMGTYTATVTVDGHDAIHGAFCVRP
jgi:hypothetical protein